MVELNYKILVVFHNLKSYDSHHVMQEQGILSFKVNAIPIGLEKYMSYNINNKLIFNYSFQFLSSALENLFKNLDKNDFLSISVKNLIWKY